MNRQHYLLIYYLILLLFFTSVKKVGFVKLVPSIPPNPPIKPPTKHNPGL